MSWPVLKDDVLYVFVLGPGLGESIVVRCPPDGWLVVDSFIRPHDRATPTAELLQHYQVQTAAIVLTHPHQDHAGGFHRLLQQVVSSGPVGCCDRWILSTPAVDDAVAILREDQKRAALMSIKDTWDRSPSRRWSLIAGSQQRVGDSDVTAVYPTEEACALATAGPNRIATPLLVEWRGFRGLLGSDLDHAGWADVCPGAPPYREHNLFKVSHHGSRENQHADLLGGPTDRIWTLTPWMQAGRTLPRLEDGQGIELLLKHVSELKITMVPLNSNRRTHVRRSRQKLIAELRGEVILGAFAREDPNAFEQSGGWLVFGFNDAGKLVESIEGPSSVTVMEARAKRTPRNGTKPAKSRPRKGAAGGA